MTQEKTGLFGLFRRSGAAEEARAAEAATSPQQREMCLRLTEFESARVYDVMIPRADIVAVDVSTGLQELIAIFAEEAHSRLPVYRDTLDEPIGLVHLKDVVSEIARPPSDLPENDVLLERLRRDILFVPDSMRVTDLLVKMQTTRIHLALVVDEYGELQGMITLEDILEEIVGAIHDEHDVQIQGVRAQADGSVNVDGWVPIRDLNRATGWALPDEEAVTVAGLVIHEAQTIPEPGQSFVFHGYRFNILRRQRNQVTGVNISKVEAG